MHVQHQNHMGTIDFAGLEALVLILALSALLLYPVAAFISGRKYGNWPKFRYMFWFFGIIAAASTLTGPLAHMAHGSFTGRMIGHLLLGMLAPRLLVFSKPMTLLMRTLSVPAARNLSRLLKSRYVQFITNPLVASILNIGGLYILYMTGLFTLMHSALWLYALVHLHVFLAGYLFTISIVYIDLTSHRYSFIYRAVILVLALGFHKVLSKLIYASPPEGVVRQDGEIGAMVMYYGGDIVDLALIIILCYQWYRRTAPRDGKVMREDVPGY